MKYDSCDNARTAIKCLGQERQMISVVLQLCNCAAGRRQRNVDRHTGEHDGATCHHRARTW